MSRGSPTSSPCCTPCRSCGFGQLRGAAQPLRSITKAHLVRSKGSSFRGAWQSQRQLRGGAGLRTTSIQPFSGKNLEQPSEGRIIGGVPTEQDQECHKLMRFPEAWHWPGAPVPTANIPGQGQRDRSRGRGCSRQTPPATASFIEV